MGGCTPVCRRAGGNWNPYGRSPGPMACCPIGPQSDCGECGPVGALPCAADMPRLWGPRADCHICQTWAPHLAPLWSTCAVGVLDGLLPDPMLRAGVSGCGSPLPQLQAAPVHLPEALSCWDQAVNGTTRTVFAMRACTPIGRQARTMTTTQHHGTTKSMDPRQVDCFDELLLYMQTENVYSLPCLF